MKNVLMQKFITALESNEHLSLTEPQRRNVANILAVVGTEVHDENFKNMNTMYQELILKHEKTRKQFIGMVNFIEKSTKVLLDVFKSNTFVKSDYDPIKKKNVIKGRTSMVTDMVDYLNRLNDLVIKFYDEVYEVPKISEKEKEREHIQSSLF